MKQATKTASKTAIIITGVLLGITTLIQLFALLGGVVFNAYNDFTTQYPWLVPTWAVALVLLVGSFVCLVKSRRTAGAVVSLCASVVGAVLAVVVAVWLQRILGVTVTVNGDFQGMTAWRLWYRHLSSAVVGGMILIQAIIQVFVRRIAALDAEEEAARRQIGSTLGFEETVVESPRKLKRSQKNAVRKEKSQE